MSTIERCVHQFLNPVWEGCKICAYDPENNKKCAGYSPTGYDLIDKKSELIISEQIEMISEPVLRVVRA